MSQRIKRVISILMAAAMITTVTDAAVPMRAAAMDSTDGQAVEEIKNDTNEEIPDDTDLEDNETKSKSDAENVVDNTDASKDMHEDNESENTDKEVSDSKVIENEEEVNAENQQQDEVALFDTLTYGALTYTVNNNEVTITGCDKNVTKITVPSQIDNMDVVAIGNRAFENCTLLTELVIADGVKSLGAYIIQGTAISSITIPKTVTKSNSSISGGSLAGCKTLKEVRFEDGMKEIPAYICASGDQTSYIEKVYIPSTVVSIGSDAFYKCKNMIGKIVLPEKLNYIGWGAFSDCEKIESVEFIKNDEPEFVRSIDSYAFSGCTSLSDVELSETETTIGSCVFSRCTSLKELVIPNGVRSLGSSIIEGTSISSITIPKTVTKSNSSISGGSLAGCKTLKEVRFEDGIKEIPAYICASGDQTSYIEKVYIPSTVVSIGSYAFYKCDNMTIYCEANSYAQQYAIENNIPYVTGDFFYGESTKAKIYITGPESISGSAEVVCNIKLNRPDRSFLEEYIKLLKTDVEYDLNGGSYLIIGSITYEISDNGKTALYRIPISARGNGNTDARVCVTSVSGYTVSLPIKVRTSNVMLCFKDKPKSQRKETLLWNNILSKYDADEINTELTINFNPKNQDEKLVINTLNLELTGDIGEYLKIKGKKKIKVNKTLPAGETYSCPIKLVKKGMIWGKPESGVTESGAISADIDMSGNISYESEKLKLTVEVSNPYDKTQDDALNASIDNDISKYTNEIVKAYEKNDLSSKIALDPQIESYIGRRNHQEEGIKMAIYMAVSLANMSKDNTSGSNLSDEAVEKMMDKFLGDWNPKLPKLKVNNIPLTIRVRDDNNKWVICNFECNITHYNWSLGNPFGITGTISTKLSFPGTGKRPVELADGMFYKTDMKAFTEGAWDLSKSYLLKGYKKVWGDDVNKAVNHITEKSIDSIADKAAEYGLKKPVQDALNAFYKEKFDGEAADKIFDFLVYPSKIASARCPVDVFVYNSSDELVGSIENNTVTKVSDGLNLWVENDDKYVQLYDESYRVEYKANGSGDMDVEIYDLSSGLSTMRCTEYQALPLETGVTYKGNVNNEILTDPENYVLTSNNDESFNYDLVEDLNEYDETSYDKYGFKSSIKNESGQTIVTFTNDSYDITSGIGIIAEYDNTGKMISVQTKELSLDFNESESITLNDSNVRYKAYVLDPKNGLQMLSPVVEYNRLNA